MVHLAQPLHPTDVGLVFGVFGPECGEGRVVGQVQPFAAEHRGPQRRQCVEQAAALDEPWAPRVEERFDERADVQPVVVGVGHADDAVVAELVEVEVVADAAAHRQDEVGQ